MNAIQHNGYTEVWRKLGEQFIPEVILMISAHWFTDGLLSQDQEEPDKINDMGGFPEAMYDLSYQVNGDKVVTGEIKIALGDEVTIHDHIDHGAWSVLVHMYPEADVPVVQLSVDRTKTSREQFEVGKKIAQMRNRGYMIVASGNVVHNLQL